MSTTEVVDLRDTRLSNPYREYSEKYGCKPFALAVSYNTLNHGTCTMWCITK